MFWFSHIFSCNTLLILIKNNLMLPFWQGELTSLVVYCSKTIHTCSILLCGYVKHRDAQSLQQVERSISIKVMNQINLLSAVVSKKNASISPTIVIVSKELILDIIHLLRHMDSLKTMSVWPFQFFNIGIYIVHISSICIL